MRPACSSDSAPVMEVIDTASTSGPVATPPPRADTTPTPPGEAPGRGWFVVYSKPHKERTAEFHLRQRSVEVFYPRLRLPGYVDPRRQIVPLFPGYLFVRIVLGAQLGHVMWAPGVSRFIGTHGVPTALDDEVVAFIKANADADGLLRARPALAVGQHVEITRGPFAGIVGIIQRPPNAKGRIRVLMRLLSRRTVGIELPLHFVKTGWAPSTTAVAASSRSAPTRA
jgi:transcription antitermination factor NusG